MVAMIIAKAISEIKGVREKIGGFRPFIYTRVRAEGSGAEGRLAADQNTTTPNGDQGKKIRKGRRTPHKVRLSNTTALRSAISLRDMRPTSAPSGLRDLSPSAPAKEKKKPTAKAVDFSFGRGRRTRTHDPWFWRPVLYQLSYTPVQRRYYSIHRAPLQALFEKKFKKSLFSY